MKRLTLLERERDASHPNHQFNYQISQERERVYDQRESGAIIGNVEIAMEAYENVKKCWDEWGIWDT